MVLMGSEIRKTQISKKKKRSKLLSILERDFDNIWHGKAKSKHHDALIQKNMDEY